LERALNLPLKRPAGPGTYRHECGDPQCPVCRLFGAVGESWRAPNLPARLRVRDLPLTAESTERLRDLEGGLDYTELKFEMALGRSTQAANLRQIERVPAGAEFAFELLYDVERPEDIEPDLRHILQALALLEDDALGGHGARGYGRVRFRVKTMEAQTVDYYRDGDPSQERRVELSEGTIAECRACLPEMVNLFW
jgi:CRISPR-associated protein Csm3